jgi:hypothetical protein
MLHEELQRCKNALYRYINISVTYYKNIYSISGFQVKKSAAIVEGDQRSFIGSHRQSHPKARNQPDRHEPIQLSKSHQSRFVSIVQDEKKFHLS